MEEFNLLEVNGLKKHFPLTGGIFRRVSGTVKAVDGVNIKIKSGETFGLVGESGCGKTTLGRCILRLIEPTEGKVLFEGKSLLKLNKKELQMFRQYMQIVFQDPYSSLDPRLTVRQTISIPLKLYNIVKGNPEGKILEVIRDVGLEKEHIDRYPHEFSGGQRQRIGIARALTVNPKFIVLDEPTSALDVSVQAKILNLLKHLQDENKFTYLFISHNLEVVRYMSDRIAVMYLGKIMEIAVGEELFERQFHPYTQALLSAVPVPDPESKKKRILLTGDVPTPINPPIGCNFNPRCSRVLPICRDTEPQLREIRKDHYVACHLY